MDELQSMGLTAEVEYIPIDTSKVPYTFSIKRPYVHSDGPV